MYKSVSASVLLLALYCGSAFADELGSRHEEKTELVDAEGTGKLYFTGPGYTINLIPQAILLGILAFLAVYFLGLDLFGSNSAPSGYGAPSVGYGAPEPSYGAPAASYGAPAASYGAPAAGYDAPASGYSASGRYYETYPAGAANSLNEYDNDRRKRSSF